jgi:serine protease Do
MNRNIFTGILCLLVLGTVTAQQPSRTKEKKEKEEIIIKNKKEGNEKMTIVIDGDNITVNGKPVTEYKGGDLIIKHDNPDKMFMEQDRMRMERDMERMQEDIAKMEREYKRSLEPQMRELERMKIRKYPGPGADNFVFDFNHDGFPEMKAFADSKPRTQLGVSMEKGDKGIKVTDVVSESPAGKAGFKDGDVITKFNGKAVTDPEELASMVREKKPGDEVEITYLPVGQKKEKKIKVKLGETKGQTFTIHTPSPKIYATPRIAPQPFGWDKEFNEDMFHYGPPGRIYKYEGGRPMFGIRIQDTEDSSGVKVLDVQDGSLADNAGIQENDIITQIDGKQVKDTDDAREALSATKEKNQYSVNLKRSGTPMTMQVKIPVKLKKADL